MQGEPVEELIEFHPAIARAASRGLHDAAQPLTVLQGLLELTLLRARTVEEYRESLTAALGEMARVTACFENVRQLVRLQEPAPDVSNFSVWQAVHAAADQLRTVGKTVAIDPDDANNQALIHASQGRTRQALSLLMSAATLSGEGEIQVSIEPRAQTVAVRVKATGSRELLGSGLEMARRVAASAGGDVRLGETPISIMLILPRAVPRPVVDQSTATEGTLNHV